MAKGKKTAAKDEVGELRLLVKISDILDRSVHLGNVIGPVLEHIAGYFEQARAAVSLFDREASEIVMETAHGLKPGVIKSARYKIGEGITGSVFEAGKPAVIPAIGKEPAFLNKAMALDSENLDNAAFVCVPIKLENETLGTLSVLLPEPNNPNLLDTQRLLTVIGSMIARAVSLRRKALEERNHLLEENARLHAQLRDRFKPSNIIGTSKAMRDVYEAIAQVCRGEATVLLLGESGVGKELVAHAIHFNSNRAAGPFVKVNCAALPESVLESELFGHERGAFTGAHRTRQGRFEQANGGTLFLDEIGDFSPAIQVTLLRILQEKELERVGGDRTIKVDVRIVAATNRDLESMMQEGNFRQDLYYRLNVFPIHVPPLRERKTDIPLLTDHFIEKYNKVNHKSILRISSAAIDMLMSYHWPGNVRELENCIERAVLVARDNVIRVTDLPPTLQTGSASGTRFPGRLQDTLNQLERELIVEALSETGGNMTQAAKALGISERQIGLRVKKYKIKPKTAGT